MIKKIVTGLGIAGLLCLVPLSVNYICNMRFIRNYDKGIYKSSEVNQVLVFFQPYIYHYNNGNVYYNEEDYQGAEEEYRTALGYKPRGERDCMTRINLALAIVKQIDPESVTQRILMRRLSFLMMPEIYWWKMAVRTGMTRMVTTRMHRHSRMR